MVIYTGYGIWLSGADTCRCMHFNAADMQCQWKVAQFSRCTVYIMYLCLCDRDLDEDEMMRFLTDQHYQCPYYRSGDEYRVVRKQM